MEATLFALPMAVFNAGNPGSQVVGGYLYHWLGYKSWCRCRRPSHAVGWFLVPLVKIDRIEATAQAPPSRLPCEPLAGARTSWALENAARAPVLPYQRAPSKDWASRYSW